MALGTNTNRLNFPNMVNRQISVHTQPIAETYFNPLIITGKRKPIEKKESKRAEMSTSFNSIIASVHNKLKSTQQVFQKVRKLEESKTLAEETKDPGSEPATNKPFSQPIDKAKSDVINIKKTEPKVNIQKPPTSSPPPKSISIPQIKANRASKQLQRMRRNIPKIRDHSDPLYQKRIIEVREQKKILEDMLMQHQRLQRDRQSIAMEIQSMREHLSDIRHKLDVSFKRLTTKPIAYTEVLAKPKVFIRPQQWRGSFTRKPPLASAAKSPTPHSILKVTNAKPAISPTKSINQKDKTSVQNKKSTSVRTTSATRNKKMVGNGSK